jgi:hypothetical protein
MCKNATPRGEAGDMRPASLALAFTGSLAIAAVSCAPDSSPSADTTPDRAPLARLTSTQYNNTIYELFAPLEVPLVALPPELEGHGGFRNNADLALASPALVEAYQRAAMVVADAVVSQIDGLLPCAASEEPACASAYLDDLAARAWRRPLTTAESDSLHAELAAWMDAHGFTAALRLSIASVLMAPDFVYLPRIGIAGPGEARALDSWELATRLSYLLWNSPPDQTLRELAASDALRDRNVLIEQAWRMLADERARLGIVQFHRELFEFDEIGSNDLDLDLYADAFPEVEDVGDFYFGEYVPSMRHEPEVFVAQHVLAGEGTLRALLTSNRAWVPLEALDVAYGVPMPSEPPIEWIVMDDAAVLGAAYSEPWFWAEYYPVELDPTQRAGLLTLASWLSASSGPRQPSPVKRGAMVLDRLMCRELAPPGDVPPLEESTMGTNPRTNREKYEIHTENPACAGCHQSIDGIGFAFEHYDSLGRFRTHDGDVAVDASGEIVGTDVDRTVSDAVEMMHALADSRDVHDCYVRQWFRYAFGRDEAMDDEEFILELQDGFWAAEGDIPALVVNLVASYPFTHRRSP